MGGTNSIIKVPDSNTTINLNDYECSDRGLLLPCKLCLLQIFIKIIYNFFG
jgi:hypothetical protein